MSYSKRNTLLAVALVVIIILLLGILAAIKPVTSTTTITTTETATSLPLNEICTVVNYYHSYSYNPFNNVSYTYTNTTMLSTLTSYASAITESGTPGNIVTITGTTETFSGIPGLV